MVTSKYIAYLKREVFRVLRKSLQKEVESINVVLKLGSTTNIYEHEHFGPYEGSHFRVLQKRPNF